MSALSSSPLHTYAPCTYIPLSPHTAAHIRPLCPAHKSLARIVSILQHTSGSSAYASIREHTRAYVSIREHTDLCGCDMTRVFCALYRDSLSLCLSLYLSLSTCVDATRVLRVLSSLVFRSTRSARDCQPNTIRQHTSACMREHRSA